MQSKLPSALEGLWQLRSPAEPHPVPKHEGTSDSGLAWRKSIHTASLIRFLSR